MMRVSIGRALLLLALVVGASVGAATAAHADAPTAPPISAITTPVSQAPAIAPTGKEGPGPEAYAIAGMRRMIAVSCQPSVRRPAWMVPVQTGVLSWMRPPQEYGVVASMPVIDTAKLGWPVELLAYGTDPTTPILRSGCLENEPVLVETTGGKQFFAVAQDLDSWGDPSRIDPSGVNGAPGLAFPRRIAPGSGQLAILPGQSTTAYPAHPVTPSSTAPAPTGTQSQPVVLPGDEGGNSGTASHPHGRNATPAYLAAAATLLAAAWSRRRVRADLAGVEIQRSMTAQLAGQTHGALGAGVDALDALSAYLTPLAAGLAVAFWPGWVAYPMALAMAVIAASTLAARYACSHGVQLRASDVLGAARQLHAEPRAMLWPGAAALAAAALGELSGWGLALCVWAGVGALLLASGVRSVAVRQRAAAGRAALADRVAAVLGVSPARLAEVRWTVGAASSISIATPPETMLRLADLPGRVAQAMPDYEVMAADAHQIVLIPASAETQQARATHAATGGLVTDTGGEAPTAAMPYPAGDSEAPLVISESDLDE